MSSKLGRQSLLLACTLGGIALAGCFTAIDDEATLVGQIKLEDQLCPEDLEGCQEGEHRVQVEIFTRNTLLSGNPEVLVDATLSDASGTFFFTSARAPYRLRFTKAGYLPRDLSVAFNRGTARFEVTDDPQSDDLAAGTPLGTYQIIMNPDRGAQVSGQLVTPIEGFAFNQTIGRLVARTTTPITVQPDGAFLQSDLAPGVYGLEVEAPGHAPLSQLVTLGPGLKEIGQVPLVPIEVSIQGLVELADEATSEDVVVRFSRGEVFEGTTLTNEAGQFAFRGLPVAYRVSLSKVDFIPRDIEVVFDESGRFTVEGEPLSETPIRLSREPLSDRDRDGVIDTLDNCLERFNPGQENIDGDGEGDACDRDADNDGVVGALDNCPLSFNPSQEDFSGQGQGVVCAAGTLEQPFNTLCGITGQRLNTFERVDRHAGSCGGAGAPELVYRLSLSEGAVVSVRAEADFPLVMYIFDEDNNPRGCVLGGRLTLPDDIALPVGNHTLVIDGFAGKDASGPVRVDITNSACQGAFGDARQEAAGSDPSAVVTGDFDNDGRPDLAVANKGEGSVHVLLGRGDGGVRTRRSLQVGTNPTALDLGDVDNDGNLDIVVANEGTRNADNGSVSVLRGRGDGTFERQQTFPSNSTVRGVAVSDFDKDGKDDALVSQTNAMVFLRSVGDGTLEVGARVDDFFGRPEHLVDADLNSDGNPDVVISLSGANIAFVLLGRGDGTFDYLEDDALIAGFSQSGVTVGDFNGDAIPDAALANLGLDVANVFLGRGDGTFGPAQNFDLGNRPEDIQSADLNGDGDLDLISANDEGIFVQTGRGNGTFEEARILAAGDRPFSIVVADLNRDGRSDLISANRDSDDLSIILGEDDSGLAPQRTFFTGFAPFDLKIADLNGDHRPDAIARIFDGFYQLINFGQGVFETRIDRIPESEDFIGELAIADLNGDGLPDAITSRDNELMPFLGQRGGGFEPAPTYTGGSRLFAIHAADINKDGHPDVLATDIASDTLLIFRGVGDGSFEEATTLDAGEDPAHIVTADFNEDGNLDVFVLNSAFDGFTTLFDGNGDGTFEEGRTLPGVDLAKGAAVGDIDGDGHLDVALAGISPRILLGDGDGGFDARPDLTTEGSVSSVALLDTDNDGDLDLVFTEDFAQRIEIRFGRGDGTFTGRERHAIGSNPISLNAADFNSDGRPDFIVANSTDITLSMLLSYRPLNPGRAFQDNAAAPCSAITVQGSPAGPTGLRWDVPQPTCRVDRIDLSLDFDPNQAPQPITLTSPSGFSATFPEAIGDWPGPAIWRPEAIGGLARFQGHLSTGPWSLEAPFDLRGGELRINDFPDDPFDPERPAPVCDAEADQSANPDEVCRLTTPLAELAISAGDEDVFLLQGPAEGVYLAGQTINLRVEADADADLDIQLRAFRARAPLLRAAQTSPGIWTLAYLVPGGFSARAFSVHITASETLSYSVSAGVP